MKEKVCNKCNLPKPINRFRFRSKNGYTWQQGFCKDCEAEAERCRRNVDRLGYNKKQNERNRNLPTEVKQEKYKKNWLKRKGTKWLSEYRSRYWRENEEQRQKHKVIAANYHKNQVENLTDKYVVAHIIQRTPLKKEDIPKELIEVVRSIKIINRKIKEQCQKV